MNKNGFNTFIPDMMPSFDDTLIAELQKELSDSRKICLITHKKPDGDALGSMLALGSVLSKLGHDVTMFSPDAYPNFLLFLEGSEKIIQVDLETEESNILFSNADLIFCLDFNDLDRCGLAGGMIEQSDATVVMIDHHLHPKKFAGLTFSFPDAAATAELVYHLIKRMNWRTYIGPSEASALYCGIMTDTGSFRFNSMSGDLHQVIADLFTTGFNHTAVHEKIFDSFSESRLRLLGYSITEGMKINWEYRVAIIALSKDILQKYQYKTGDSEGFVNYGLSISGIEIAILLSERENEVRISMRSRVDQDVRSIASEYFNGGGHKNAAGGVSKISLESTIEKIEELLPEFVSKGYLKLL